MKKIFLVLFSLIIFMPFKVNAQITIWADKYKLITRFNGTFVRTCTTGNSSFDCTSNYLVDRYEVLASTNNVTISNSNLSILNFTISSTMDFDINTIALSANGDSKCFFNVSTRIETNDYPNEYVKSVSAYCPYEYGTFTRNTDQMLVYILTESHYPLAFSMTGLNYINDNKIISDYLNSLNSNLIENQETLDNINENLKNLGFDSQPIIDNQNQNQQQTNDRLDSINENQQQTNEKLDDLNKTQQETNDFLKDDTAPESDISGLGNVQGLLPPGPVDNLLNIPFDFLSIVTSSFGGVCVPISGNFVLDQPLTIPCFSELIYDNVPASVMVFLELVPTTFMLITYFKHLYKKVSRAVSLETTGDDEWGVL